MEIGIGVQPDAEALRILMLKDVKNHPSTRLYHLSDVVRALPGI
jgi:hypothetical protein